METRYPRSPSYLSATHPCQLTSDLHPKCNVSHEPFCIPYWHDKCLILHTSPLLMQIMLK